MAISSAANAGSIQRLVGLLEASQGAQQPSGQGFSDQLSLALESVDSRQNEADQLLAGLASGEHANLHGTMVALEKADISLRTMVSVRDKVVNAYESVMNMAI